MALSVAVQADIGEYKEKIVFGLSRLQLVTLGVGLACAAAEAIVATAVLHQTLNDVFILMCITLTCAFLLGFVRPLGLKFSQAGQLYAGQIFGSTQLLYKSSVYLSASKQERRTHEYVYFKKACQNSRCPEVDIPRIAAGKYDAPHKKTAECRAEAIR